MPDPGPARPGPVQSRALPAPSLAKQGKPHPAAPEGLNLCARLPLDRARGLLGILVPASPMRPGERGNPKQGQPAIVAQGLDLIKT